MNVKTMMTTLTLALALGSTVAFGADAAAPAAATAAPAAAAAAPAARPKMTEAQRAEMRARREKFMAQRRAAMEARMLEVVKKYIPEEEKAKALVKELEAAVLSRPRGPKGHPLPSPKRPAAAKPVEAPAAPAAK